MLKKNKTLSSILLVMIVVVLKISTPVSAAEDTMIYEPFIVVSSYKVSGDIIIPGERFDLSIEVENTDEKVATRGLLMTISFPDGISTAYGSSNQVFLNSLKPGEKREITFKLYASPYYARSQVPFSISFTSEVRTNSASIFAPVQLDSSTFKVVSQNIPNEANVGEKIAVSLSFKSLLEEKLSNVILYVYVDNDSKPVTSANIGNISVGASKTQNLTFFINEKGRHSIKYELSYTNSEGESATAELYSGKIQVYEQTELINLPANEGVEPTINKTDKLIIVGCLGASLILFVGIVLVAKKYN